MPKRRPSRAPVRPWRAVVSVSSESEEELREGQGKGEAGERKSRRVVRKTKKITPVRRRRLVQAIEARQPEVWLRETEERRREQRRRREARRVAQKERQAALLARAREARLEQEHVHSDRAREN